MTRQMSHFIRMAKQTEVTLTPQQMISFISLYHTRLDSSPVQAKISIFDCGCNDHNEDGEDVDACGSPCFTDIYWDDIKDEDGKTNTRKIQNFIRSRTDHIFQLWPKG